MQIVIVEMSDHLGIRMVASADRIRQCAPIPQDGRPCIEGRQLVLRSWVQAVAIRAGVEVVGL
jgi:hypothetical protein